MSQYTIELPEELEAFIVAEGFTKPEDYIEIALMRPLMEKYQFQKEQEKLKELRATIDSDIKKTRDKALIKKVKTKGA
jgi:hypothetical protein